MPPSTAGGDARRYNEGGSVQMHRGARTSAHLLLASTRRLLHKAPKQLNIMRHPRIPAKVLTELNRQINHELNAAQGYRALSIWCAAQNFKGFASYFAKQSAEELEHADKITGHLIDRGCAPELASFAAPKQDFKSLLEVARQAQAMEEANTRGIHAVYEAALAAKDYPAQVLMHWFIQEQVEEEAWSTEMVERVQAATCAGGLSDLDRHVERLLAKEEAKG